MAKGLCDACEAVALRAIKVKATEVKTAVKNGFRPRYGKAEFESTLMATLGKGFGLQDLKPPKEMQDAQHAKSVASFLAAIEEMDENATLELCDVCAGQVSGRTSAPVKESAPLPPGATACAMCGHTVLALPNETAHHYHLPTWLRNMADKGFRCNSCLKAVCTNCMLSHSSNPLGPTQSLSIDLCFRGRDEVEGGIDWNSACALCIQLVLDQATCPMCHSQSVGYAEKERRDEERARKTEEDREKTRVREIKTKRQTDGVCINCGNPLGFFQRLAGRTEHPACKAFRD